MITNQMESWLKIDSKMIYDQITRSSSGILCPWKSFLKALFEKEKIYSSIMRGNFAKCNTVQSVDIICLRHHKLRSSWLLYESSVWPTVLTVTCTAQYLWIITKNKFLYSLTRAFLLNSYSNLTDVNTIITIFSVTT